jgi:hypothetical protein
MTSLDLRTAYCVKKEKMYAIIYRPAYAKEGCTQVRKYAGGAMSFRSIDLFRVRRSRLAYAGRPILLCNTTETQL